MVVATVLSCPQSLLGLVPGSRLLIEDKRTQDNTLMLPSDPANYGTVGYTFEPSGSVVGVEVLTEVARLSRCVLVLDHHFLISIRQKSRAGPNA